MPSITSKRRQLPSIEEAWNLPISAEMSSRQQQTTQSNQQRAYTKNYNHVSWIFVSNQPTEEKKHTQTDDTTHKIHVIKYIMLMYIL